jgi:predicted ATPase
LEVAEHGIEPIGTTLVQALQGKKLLLILDNFEQVQPAGSQLGVLLDQLDQIKILVTSQIPLDLAQEQCFRIPPLAAPAHTTAEHADTLLQFPAIALFVDRVTAIQPSFRLSEANAAAVIEICHRLKGLPLAIELVAAHSRALTPQDLLVLLRNHLALRAYTSSATDSRESILRVVIEWCYAMLTSELQTLCMRLGIFIGGWTIESMSQVCNAQANLTLNLPEGLQTLVEKHLVLSDPDAGEQRRYTMLDAVRTYAEDRLVKTRQRSALALQHATYYAQLAETAEPALKGAQQNRWLDRLSADHPNLRSAMTWAVHTNHADLAARIAGGVARFWYLRGHLYEGRAWLERILAQEAAITVAQQATLFQGLGTLLYTQGDYAQAKERYTRSLELRRELGDEVGAALLYNNIGSIVWQQGDLAQAQSLFSQSLALLRPRGEDVGIANALSNLAVIASERGDWPLAEQYYTECAALWRRLNNQSGLAITLNNLGQLLLEQGQYDQAQRVLAEGLAISQELRLAWMTAAIHHVQGFVALEQQQYAAAYAVFKASFQSRHAMGEQHGMADSLLGLASWATLVGAYPLATSLLARAATLRTAIDADFDPYQQRWHDRITAQIRPQLAVEEWDAFWQNGAQLALDDVPAMLTGAASIMERDEQDSHHHGP